MKTVYKILANREAVFVESTPTIMIVSQTGPSEVLTAEVINGDGSQTLDCVVDVSWDGISNWESKNTQDLSGIEPGGVRHISLDVSNFRFIRIMGTASGAGLNATVSVELSHNGSGRA